jgi:hypothetical protein
MTHDQKPVEAATEIFLPWKLLEDEGVSYIQDAQGMVVAEGHPAAIRHIVQLVTSAEE